MKKISQNFAVISCNFCNLAEFHKCLAEYTMRNLVTLLRLAILPHHHF